MSDEPGLVHALSDTIGRATDLTRLEMRAFKAELEESWVRRRSACS